MDTIAPQKDFDYYLGNVYWNDFKAIQDKINLAISGDASLDWQNYLYRKFGTFNNALFLNCGNGWVERQCFEKKLVNQITAFDFSEDLISEAVKKAAEISLPSNYVVADCNSFYPPEGEFDLVVNHAAMHHVAYINRLTLNLAKSLKDMKSLYVAFDYIGPHRNQYPWLVWEEIIKVNDSLPKKYQLDLAYPHMKTMLAWDPTEAIHSELQIEVLNRYFDFSQYTPLGGAIAYTLLNLNIKLHQDQFTAEGKKTINKIIESDNLFCEQYPEYNLFAFWVANRKSALSIDSEEAKAYQDQENIRETNASLANARYYSPTALEIIYDNFDITKRLAIDEWRNNYDILLASQDGKYNIKSWKIYKALRKVYHKLQKK